MKTLLSLGLLLQSIYITVCPLQSGYIYTGPAPPALMSPITSPLFSQTINNITLSTHSTPLGLRITLKSSTLTFFTNTPGNAFLYSLNDSITHTMHDGNVKTRHQLLTTTSHQHITTFTTTPSSFILSGSFSLNTTFLPYVFTINVLSSTHVTFHLNTFSNASVLLTFDAQEEETYHGLGQQYTYTTLNEKLIPILTREQGIGRGVQPISTLLNLYGFAGGDEYTTYSSVPHFVSSKGRSVWFTSTAFQWFDFRQGIVMGVRGEMRGGMAVGPIKSQLDIYRTTVSGVMKPLPPWIGKGIIAGVQGGEERVKEIVTRLIDRGVRVTAVWIQDWCGLRQQTLLGKIQSRLWWNWEHDVALYPNFKSFVQEMNALDIKVLAYINPYITDAAHEKINRKRNMYEEGINGSYFIKQNNGSNYVQSSGPKFNFATVDLTNPKARKWYIDMIKTELLAYGVSGWMADFGESVPFDAVFHTPTGSSEAMHNEFPTLWAKLMAEAAPDAFYFLRSSNQFTPGYVPAFWAGDQLPRYDEKDGLRSVLNAYLSSAVSGFTQHHSDIGGYTTCVIEYRFTYSIRLPYRTPGFKFTRDKELMLRWMELEVFSSVLRSHEGGAPSANVQIYDVESLDIPHVKRYVDLYILLWKEREYISDSHAMIRPVYFEFEACKEAWHIFDQFMFGRHILVAPVFDAGVVRREMVLFGKGNIWVHYWSRKEYPVIGETLHVNVDAELGHVPFMVLKGSLAYKRLILSQD